MIVEQKNNVSNNNTNVNKKKISIKGLFIFSCFWLLVFISALTLIVNLFRPQWEKIGANVQSLVNTDWQKDNQLNNELVKNELENILASQESTRSSLEAIDIVFLEGLVKAILTASEGAQTATGTAKIR